METAAGDPVALLTMDTLPDVAPAPAGENCTAKVMLCDGERVTADPPDKVRLEPVSLMLEIDTLELPVLVTAMFREALFPTVTLPKLIVEGLTESVKPAATPVPVRLTVDVAFVALLLSARFPVTAPALLGWNSTLNVLFCPAASVRGTFRPEVVKPVPVMFAAETVTLTVPGLESCTVWVLVTPATTLPKLTEPGETVSAGATACGAAVAVPETVTVVTAPWELVSKTVPVFVPAVVGLNFTVRANVSPGTITTGVARPVVENPEPLQSILDKLRFPLPAFLRVVTAVVDPPTLTVPRLKTAGVAVNLPTASVVATPARSTFVVGLSGSLLEMLTRPENVPAAFGEKVTFKSTLLPAGILVGGFNEPAANVDPVTATPEILRVDAPEFVMVNGAVATVFTVTLPKS